MRLAKLLLGLLLLLAGAAPVPADQTYPGRGVIQQIAPDRRSVTIAHEAIPGYMAAMTMTFDVRNTNALNGLAPADQVTFRLVVRDNDDWVENLQRTGRGVPLPAPVAHAEVAELKPGDPMPSVEFATEAGARGSLADFHGQAVAFTFFFTSCPLPDFCPRMNKNFASARNLLAAQSTATTNWEFLSLSFDPAFDTPAILSNYATMYRGTDPGHWLFASLGTNALAQLAPRLDLMVVRSSQGISHNLRTVVVDPNGRVYRLFDGNTWTPQQLADAMLEAARAP